MSIELKEHNVVAYEKVISMLRSGNMAAVIHPTGTGKSYIALKLVEDNLEKRVLYLAPSNAILHQIKQNSIKSQGKIFRNLSRMTYQKLSKFTDEEIEELKPDIIILDEFHHCGSPVWGDAVRKLIENNPNAKVLGLSATPIRYFDGNIDMAEEFFDGNIASEISFEEAVERNILPSFDYVSAMYQYNDSIESFKNRVETANVTHSKKLEAARLYEELESQLQEDTKELHEILNKHMKNKSGKYLVFCKDIEDLNKKMEEAKSLFKSVNPNITMYHVSSEENIRENERELNRFENDNDLDKLKLMFSVNMLNEGYHIPSIDGVIMMRPTKSPTIFLQQLGRALTVGNSKRATIIDLVDNFDSISIIERSFSELRKYNVKDEKGINKGEKHQDDKVSIYDYTKNIREMINRIEKLTIRRSLTLSEKIDLFEKFIKETGHPITIDTIFEGYPIGMMLIQLRSSINKNGLEGVNISKEDLERLNKLNLLEKSLLKKEERVARLETFVKKYPILWGRPRGKSFLSVLKNIEKTSDIEDAISFLGIDNIKTLDELKAIIEECELCKKSYEYLSVRLVKGKLTKEEIFRLKEAGVGGAFGFPEEIEIVMQKYGIKKSKMQEIIARFGTLENFKEAYISSLIKGEDFNYLEGKLIRAFDLSSSDLIYHEDKFPREIIELLCDDVSGNTKIYDYAKLEIFMESLNAVLSEREKIVIENWESTHAVVAKKTGASIGYISQLKARVIRIIYKHRSRPKNGKLIKEFCCDEFNEDIKETFIRAFFKNHDIFYNPDEFELASEKRQELMRIFEETKDKQEAQKESMEKNSMRRLLGLTENAYISLTQNGIETIGELINCSARYLYLLKQGEEEIYREIKGKLKDLGYSFNNERSRKENLDEFNFSVRTYNILRRHQLYFIEDIIVAYNSGELKNLRGCGKGVCQEILDKILSLGYEFDEEKQIIIPPQKYKMPEKANIKDNDITESHADTLEEETELDRLLENAILNLQNAYKEAKAKEAELRALNGSLRELNTEVKKDDDKKDPGFKH